MRDKEDMEQRYEESLRNARKDEKDNIADTKAKHADKIEVFTMHVFLILNFFFQ